VVPLCLLLHLLSLCATIWRTFRIHNIRTYFSQHPTNVICLDFCAAVQASGFIAMDMSIRNTAGPNGHQAVALRVGGDQSAFSGLSIEGYQVPILLRTYMFQTQKICSEIETKSTKMKLNSLSHECLIYCWVNVSSQDLLLKEILWSVSHVFSSWQGKKTISWFSQCLWSARETLCKLKYCEGGFFVSIVCVVVMEEMKCDLLFHVF
jgi:hypothetical protein